MWLIYGDFNMVGKISEKVGKTFNYALSNRFNSLINNLQLLELPLSDRKFTWAKSITLDSFALLDRFFCVLLLEILNTLIVLLHHFLGCNQITILLFLKVTHFLYQNINPLDLKKIGSLKIVL
jgi:hypothetical protein